MRIVLLLIVATGLAAAGYIAIADLPPPEKVIEQELPDDALRG